MKPIVLIALVLLGSPVVADTVRDVPAKSYDLITETLGRMDEILWEKTDVFFHRGNYERAIATLKLVAENDPFDVEAYSLAAWLMDSKGRKSEATDYLKLGLARNPTRYRLYTELGRMYFFDKDYATAVGYFASAVKQIDCPDLIWHSLAHAYERSGNLEKSLETWEVMLKREPDDPAVTNNLNRVKGLIKSRGEAVASPR